VSQESSIQVLYFAAARRAVGSGEEQIPFRAGMTARDVLTRCIEGHPELGPMANSMLVAVNEQWVPLDTVLEGGAVVALMPPVSGG